MKWIFEHFQLVVAIVAAVAYVLTRGKRQTEDRQDSTRNLSDADPEQAERTRRIQEEIRRKIAERRAVAGEVVASETAAERIPPLVRPAHVPPVDPFGGPMRRIMKELEQAAERRFEPEPDPAIAERAAALARQHQLAEEMRAQEAARLREEQRARELAALRKKKAAVKAPVYAMGSLRSALGDPKELRRAIVLREVLGPPVGLR